LKETKRPFVVGSWLHQFATLFSTSVCGLCGCLEVLMTRVLDRRYIAAWRTARLQTRISRQGTSSRWVQPNPFFRPALAALMLLLSTQDTQP
jgi:hypothetical protein